MANGIKIGNLDISAFKVGSADTKVYLGDTLLYPSTPPTPPGFQGKWLATYMNMSTTSADCDTSSAITEDEIALTDLVSVEIGDCVISISRDAFRDCSSLTSCTIGSGVTNIGGNAFNNCSGLTSITIPSSVRGIRDGAFNSCTSLTSITINATTPPTIGIFGTFEDTNNCPIYVPSGSVDTYKAASGWSEYGMRIRAIGSLPTLQWVTFNDGDSVDGLQAYGIKGTVSDLVEVFGNLYGQEITFRGNCINVCDYCLQIGDDGVFGCYQQCLSASDNVEVIFSNVGCSDYYTLSNTNPVGSNPIQLYIYA